ncbi:MAG: hypothetical protein AUK63_1608 [bacterium P3]|nr:MAG: hypothetical protein AUK63_1608 [bacterium P3]KWW38986.1 MAG: hypothetical protein F083_1946 [bacterium F083]
MRIDHRPYRQVQGHRIAGLWLLLCLLPLRTTAQTEDFGTEYSLSWERNVTKGGKLSLSESVRLADNSRRYRRSATEIGFDQRLLQRRLKPYGGKLSAGMSYVFVNKDNFKGANYNRHRVKLRMSASQSLGVVQLHYRLMYQHTYRTDKHTHKDHLRNRLKVSYNDKTSPWSFYLSEECFTRLNNRNTIDEWRTQLGTEYRIGRRNSVELYLRHAREQGMANPETLYMAGLGYCF